MTILRTPVSDLHLRSEPEHMGEYLRDRALEWGAVAAGWTSVRPLTTMRSRIERAAEDGLCADMAFTYLNPPRSTEPHRILPGARSILAIAWEYPCEPHEETCQAPVVASYAAVGAPAQLRELLDRLRGVLRSAGHRAVAVSDSNALVDREIAWRAGLGWIGKNSMLLVPKVGTAVVLGALVTDLEPGLTAQPIANQCGTCSSCRTACPTEAIDSLGRVDARRCIAWLLQSREPIPVELRHAIGNRLYGCDECQWSCPFTRQRQRSNAANARPEATDMKLLANADDNTLMQAVGDWYVADRNPNIVRRNIAVIIGNSDLGKEWDSILLRWAADEDALLREHAQWALRQRAQRGM